MVLYIGFGLARARVRRPGGFRGSLYHRSPRDGGRLLTIVPRRFEGNPRAQRYEAGSLLDGRETLAKPTRPPVRVEVRVELKPGIQDAEAESIQKSLSLLGIPAVTKVSTARVYDLDFSGVSAGEARRLTAEAVDRLLANPVIHRVTVLPPKP